MLEPSQPDQSALPLSGLDALRNPLFPDCNIIDMPGLAKFPWAGDSVSTELVPVLAGYPPYEQAPNLVQWSGVLPDFPAFDRQGHANLFRFATAAEEHIAYQGSFTLTPIQSSAGFIEYFPEPEVLTLIQPTVDWTISPNGNVIPRVALGLLPSFLDFACDALPSARDVLSDFVNESERRARESWKRFCRKNILSSGVSKNGHLSFLVKDYRQVCVETAARDQVVHLEVITLAKEQGGPSACAVGQILTLGWKSWKKTKSSSLSLFSNCLAKVLPFGFIDAGLNFATAKAV
jgi:hypothetical protein